ncbi:MAG: LapA family protein [Candidatus Cloacimonetes bacterium]|nr:LapA family protein [Candidatus Cloacimonadota bacterium]
MKFKTIIIIILLAIFAVILLQNTQIVELKFLFWKIQMSRIILFPITLMLGFIIGFITAKLGTKRKEKNQFENYKKENLENPGEY